QKIRQGDLYEIIQTERNHCTALAEVKKLFGGKSYRAILGDEVGVFEHIDKIFSVHYSFHGSLRKMQGDGVYIEHVGSLIHHFLTCVKQLDLDKSYGLVSYYCTRAVKELPSRTPVQITGVPLRLTKFQIQLDSLLKHSKDESEREKQLVAKSLAMVKEVLCSINEIIDCKEKEALLKTLHRKIDSKSCLFLKGVKFTKHDLKNRKLIHHAQVKINITQQKVHSVVLLLFDDVLVFLQRTSSSKYQFYQT
ncbi:Dbl (DH) domain, partial [Trinorchestia longiramus]